MLRPAWFVERPNADKRSNLILMLLLAGSDPFTIKLDDNLQAPVIPGRYHPSELYGMAEISSGVDLR